MLFGVAPVQAAELEEIVVTAQRREENLQKIPVAVTALDQEIVEKADIHDLATLATRIPGLSFSPFSPGQNIVSLRGAASNDDGAGTDNSVAMFVDDVYLGRVSNINPEMFDVERIEVLRGPQGTLYGKNTIGGAINVVSIKPDLEARSGKVRLTAGNYNRTDFAAYVNGPLSENVAAKLAFSYRNRDGWVDNVVLNKKQKDDNVWGLRGQLLYKDSDFEALLSADYQKLDVEDMARIPIRTAPYEVMGLDDRLRTVENCADYVTINGQCDLIDTVTDGGTRPDDDPEDDLTDAEDSDPDVVWSQYYETLCTSGLGSGERNPDCAVGAVDGYAKREAQGVSARLRWNWDAGKLISVTAYRKSEADWNMDSSGAQLALIDDILDETEQWSQEFRWIANLGDSINYVAGFWYLNEETDRTECFDLSLGSDCTADADGLSPDPSETAMMVMESGLRYGTDWYRQINETTSFAVFGQADWNIDESWKLTVGARYTEDEKKIQNFARRGAFVIINQTFESRENESWDAFTPRVALTWTGENISVYGLFSQGFKSGGFPAAPQTEEGTRPLAQEEATNYELGIKSQLLDNSLRLNLALFAVDYKDLQYQSFGPVPGAEDFGQFRSYNAGDAEANGAELEVTWAASDNLTLSGYYGYIDSELKDVFVPNSPFADQSGQDMIRTPKNKYNLNLDYVTELSGGSELAFNASWRHTDEQRGELAPFALQDEFQLLDASLTWTNASGSWDVSVWGRNILDEEYVSHVYTVGGRVVGVYGDPAMYGISVTYQY